MFLNGMAKASCEKFVVLVNAQIGFLAMPMASAWAGQFNNCQLQQLDEIASTCVDKYMVLRQAGEWSAASKKYSAFKADLSSGSRPINSRVPISRTPRKPFNREEWLDWYDNSVCSICGKKGHPDKHHGDPGARDRSKEGWQKLWKQRKLDAKSGPRRNLSRPAPRFKSSGDRNQFVKKMRSLLVEHADDADKQELMAHFSANDGGYDLEEEPEGDEELIAAVADMSVDEDAAVEETHEATGDEAHALAALSMDKLVNFW
jgi:hypothetical protein